MREMFRTIQVCDNFSVFAHSVIKSHDASVDYNLEKNLDNFTLICS